MLTFISYLLCEKTAGYDQNYYQKVRHHLNMTYGDQLPASELQHLRNYTNNSYLLNNVLWKMHRGKDNIDHLPDEPIIAQFGNKKVAENKLLFYTLSQKMKDPGKIIHHKIGMDNLLSKYKTPIDFHVFTGLHEPPVKAWHKLKVPLHMVHPGYISTSLHKNIAQNFAYSRLFTTLREPTISNDDYSQKGELQMHKHILRIRVPKGQHGYYAHHNSTVPREHEFILPRGTNLKIHPYPTISTARYPITQNGVHYISGENITSPSRMMMVHTHTWDADILPHHNEDE